MAGGLTRAWIAMAAVTLAACSGRGEPAPFASGPVSPADAARVVRALCALPAAAGDREEAERLFEDEAHEGLHEVAAAAQALDPAVAGALLEAKERVESALLQEPLPRNLGTLVGSLLRATRAALETLGVGAPACGSP